MLSAEASLALQSDILSTQNLGLSEPKQPEIFSLLPNSNTPLALKQPRRKKTSRLDEGQPVTLNPSLSRISTGTASTTCPHRPILSSECTSSYITASSMNGYTLPIRVCLGHSSHDANNNIPHSQIGTVAIPLHHSLSPQVQQLHTWSKQSSCIVNITSSPSKVLGAQFVETNSLPKNNPSTGTVSIPSLSPNECDNYSSSLGRIDQGSLSSPSHSNGSPTPPIFEGSAPPLKTKKKYPRKSRTMIPVDQSRLCPYPIALRPPTVSNGLPSLIPASVIAAASISEEYSRVTDIGRSTLLPLTPPSSIKSSPTNIVTEPSVASAQSNIAPCTLPHISEFRSESRRYFPDQRYPPLQQMSNDVPLRSFHRVRYAGYPQFCLMPSHVMSPGILPMVCSSTMASNAVHTALETMPPDVEKDWQKRDGEEGKSTTVRRSFARALEDRESLCSKSPARKTAVMKDRKRKHSTPTDVKTKKQLRRLIHRNRLAVLKFMIQKRKQQKQKAISAPTLLDTKVEQATSPEVPSNSAGVAEKTEPALPDIIAPSLKIRFDPSQKIESICLLYHRRRRPERNSDNRLGLLIEAMELVETFQGNPKLVVLPNK